MPKTDCSHVHVLCNKSFYILYPFFHKNLLKKATFPKNIFLYLQNKLLLKDRQEIMRVDDCKLDLEILKQSWKHAV